MGQTISRSSYHGSEILVQRIASDCLMVVSGEPDKGTEDMLPGRKLVSGGSCFDRLIVHRRKHELGKKPLGNPG
jgi:hypothetical protein